MAETQRRTIGDFEYEIPPLPTSRFLTALTRLGKALGPGLEGLLDGPAAPPANAPEDPATPAAATGVGKALASVFSNLRENELETFLKDLAFGSLAHARDGKVISLTIVFLTHFDGRPVDLFQWTRFAIEVNFGPLFGALGSIALPGASSAGR